MSTGAQCRWGKCRCVTLWPQPHKRQLLLAPADYVMQTHGTHRCLPHSHAGSLFIFVEISFFQKKKKIEWINTRQTKQNMSAKCVFFIGWWLATSNPDDCGAHITHFPDINPLGIILVVLFSLAILRSNIKESFFSLYQFDPAFRINYYIWRFLDLGFTL